MGKIIRNEQGFTVIFSGEPFSVNADHPNYDKLLHAARTGNRTQFDKFYDIKKEINNKYRNVTIRDGVVYYKDEPIDHRISERIVDYVREGNDPEPFCLFLDNMMSNPSPKSISELFGFLEHRHMPITRDGCFLAYKTVRDNYRDKYSGKVDNSVGQIIEMPREKVDPNAQRTCSYGYHVGSFEYAGPGGWYNSERDKVVIVKVNPHDAVSVPADHNAQKLRVCKYEVVSEYAQKLPSTFAM